MSSLFTSMSQEFSIFSEANSLLIKNTNPVLRKMHPCSQMSVNLYNLQHSWNSSFKVYLSNPFEFLKLVNKVCSKFIKNLHPGLWKCCLPWRYCGIYPSVFISINFLLSWWQLPELKHILIKPLALANLRQLLQVLFIT